MDEGPAVALVVPVLKSASVGGQPKAPRHGPFLLSEFLINAWGFETHTVAEQQVALGIESGLLRCLESQSHPSRVSTRRNFKIVFQTSLVSVINKVNSWVNVLIPHPRKLRNIAMPFGGIISDEVIALAGK